jgi:hypothetical protein
VDDPPGGGTVDGTYPLFADEIGRVFEDGERAERRQANQCDSNPLP